MFHTRNGKLFLYVPNATATNATTVRDGLVQNVLWIHCLFGLRVTGRLFEKRTAEYRRDHRMRYKVSSQDCQTATLQAGRVTAALSRDIRHTIGTLGTHGKAKQVTVVPLPSSSSFNGSGLRKMDISYLSPGYGRLIVQWVVSPSRWLGEDVFFPPQWGLGHQCIKNQRNVRG